MESRDSTDAGQRKAHISNHFETPGFLMSHKPFVILPLGIALACGGERAEPAPASISVADVGLQTPESVLHDASADLYLVSNINGSPVEKDGNGFITRLNPDGTVETLKWIDGTAAEVTLNAPKGMGISGDTLFVADIDAVRLFDRATGTPIASWAVPGATFLNDVAVADDGTVYVTDSGLEMGDEGLVPDGSDAIYSFQNGEPTALATGEALGNPNGVLVDGHRLLVVTFGSGAVIGVDRATGATTVLPTPPQGQLDGIVSDTVGSYLVSSWAAQAVYRSGAGGVYSTAADSLEAPADIGWDATRHRLLVPLFTANRVEIRQIG